MSTFCDDLRNNFGALSDENAETDKQSKVHTIIELVWKSEAGVSCIKHNQTWAGTEFPSAMQLTRKKALFASIVLLFGCAASCSKADNATVSTERSAPMTIQIKSAAFANGQPIPQKHTCDGEDISPALSWDKSPEGTKSLAIICDDPDAPSGTWVHWVIYDLAAATTELPEAIPAKEDVLSGAKQGKNDFSRIGYGGPCPPKGNAHRYYFKLYALDSVLNLKAGATKSDVESAMKGHVLGEGKIMGTYKRK